ncbi:MAG: biotin--[acetyl-CoA-carboxylase] ligase [Bacteroidota bacterium]|nr:biotin--[acetyl-CoA-carboxylase] ligase [Bacteroidota bacterium]
MHPDTNSLLILESVDSTNNYAMGMIRNGATVHGNAYFTHEQTHGKGRRGKKWNTEKGKNIILTIAADTMFLRVDEQFKLSVAVSLACYNFFKKYAGKDVKIKWPNDLFWNDRKAGGILIENVIKGSVWQWAAIGIGININQTEFDNANNFLPVSLKQITGKDFNIIQLAKELYETVMIKFEELKNNGFKKMISNYNENLFALDKNVKLKKNNIVFETTVKAVSPQGKLITEDAIERQFDFDEIEWIL